MQSVPAHDRPKLIAVSTGIVIALAFVAHGVAGTAARAQRPGPTPPEVNAPAAATRESVSAQSPSGAASMPGDAPFCPPAISDPPARAKLHDPFRPLAQIAAAQPVRAPAATPAPPQGAGAVPASPPAQPRAARRPAPPVAAPRPPARAPRTSTLPAAPAVRPEPLVTLTGTVGSGATGIATFRVGAQTIFAGAQETVAGWTVVRIQVGRAWLSCRNHRQMLRVGSSLPAAAPPADGDAALPAR